MNYDFTNAKLGFIGAGNMASALIKGLLEQGFAAQRIWISDVDAEKCKTLSGELGVNSASNQTLVEQCDLVVLAVKPQVMRQVCTGLELANLEQQPLWISVAAGIECSNLSAWLGDSAAIIRCMPNTPALVGEGATGLYANAAVSEPGRVLTEQLMRAVGKAVWVAAEADIDSVTALSGSGPAYFFLFMEAVEAAAVEMGLSVDAARILTNQTALGAAKLAASSAEDVAELRRRVTSPGGTTEQAIAAFQDGELEKLVAKAMAAAQRRSAELAKEFGG